MPDASGPETGPAVSRIVFDDIEYDVVDGPEDTSALVQGLRASALAQLEIDTLGRRLLRVDQLLLISACGLAGVLHPTTRQALGAQVMGLQYRLRGETGALASALSSYGEGARNMLGVLKAALKDLYGHHEADALTRLARCDTQAAKMAESAAALEGKLHGLIDDVARVAELATAACAAGGQASPGFATKRAEMEARGASLHSLGAAARSVAQVVDPGACARLAQAVGTDLATALADSASAGGDPQAAAIAADVATDAPGALAAAQALHERQREALQAMSRAALQLAGATDEGEIEEAAVLALLHAMLELEQIATLLTEQRHSLTGMASDCARLTRLGLGMEIERLLPAGAAQRAAAFSQRGFLARALFLAARWRALTQAAEAGRATLERAYAKMGESYTRNPRIEEARLLAPQLGNALAETLAAEISAAGRSERETGFAPDCAA